MEHSCHCVWLPLSQARSTNRFACVLPDPSPLQWSKCNLLSGHRVPHNSLLNIYQWAWRKLVSFETWMPELGTNYQALAQCWDSGINIGETLIWHWVDICYLMEHWSSFFCLTTDKCEWLTVFSFLKEQFTEELWDNNSPHRTHFSKKKWWQYLHLWWFQLEKTLWSPWFIRDNLHHCNV